MRFRRLGHRPGRIGQPTEVRPGSDTFPDCHHQTRVEGQPGLCIGSRHETPKWNLPAEASKRGAPAETWDTANTTELRLKRTAPVKRGTFVG